MANTVSTRLTHSHGIDALAGYLQLVSIPNNWNTISMFWINTLNTGIRVLIPGRFGDFAYHMSAKRKPDLI